MMNEKGSLKSVIRFSKSGFIIYLTKELKELGIKAGKKVWVHCDGDKIVISNDKLTIFKPFGTENEIWKDFVSMVIKKHGEKDIEKNIIKELNTCLYN